MSRPFLVIGTRSADAPYHPLEPIQGALGDIMRPMGETLFSIDRDDALSGLKNFRGILVLAQDDWERPLGDAPMSSLVSWVAEGGSLLALHQGISFQPRAEFCALIGARFDNHPEARVLRFRPKGAFAGLEPWQMRDEPYRFEFAGLQELDPLLEYDDDQGPRLCGWEKRFCSGRVIYLAPGHTLDNISEPAYAAVIRASMERLRQ